MGRLKRYKKIKAFDPFAKKSKVSLPIVDKNRQKFELSPDELDSKKKKKKSKKHRSLDFNDEDDLEKFYQREALKDIERSKLGATIESKMKKIEEKRDDETMRDYKARLRQVTRETLRDEFKRGSSTAIKRKERLKLRKLKREGKRLPTKPRGGDRGRGDDEESEDDNEADPNEDFDAIEKEFLKNKAEAREREAINNKTSTAREENPSRSHAFLGSTDNSFNAPPDLTLFKIKMKGTPKTIDLKSANSSNSSSNSNSNSSSNSSSSSSKSYKSNRKNSKFEENVPVENVKLSKSQQKKENKNRFDSLTTSNSLDDSNSMMGMMSYSGSSIMQSSQYKQNTAGRGSGMDGLRNQAINAYRDLKARKRENY